MLPEYEEPVAKKPKPLGPILPHVPENDRYAPPVILPSFEEQDPPVMHPPHEEISNHEVLKPRTSPSLLPPSHYDIAAVASRGFATNTSRMKSTHESREQGRRTYSTTSRRLTSTRAVAGSPSERPISGVRVGSSSCSGIQQWRRVRLAQDILFLSNGNFICAVLWFVGCV